jgi:LytS/YehU family sensor histidine kinase
MLTMRVSNTLDAIKPPREDGIGLKNVSERLAMQFEGHAALMARAEGAHWISEIAMPEIRDSPDRRAARRAAPWVGA